MPRLLSWCDVEVNGCAIGTSVQAGSGSARGTPRQRELARIAEQDRPAEQVRARQRVEVGDGDRALGAVDLDPRQLRVPDVEAQR